jgi:hypothetical protein
VTFPIALEEFAEAYRVTGLEPADGCYLAEDRAHACPLGAAYARLMGKYALAKMSRRYLVNNEIGSVLGLTYDQAGAFMLGFDGHDPIFSGDRDAYEAGRVARARFLPPQPPEA